MINAQSVVIPHTGLALYLGDYLLFAQVIQQDKDSCFCLRDFLRTSKIGFV